MKKLLIRQMVSLLFVTFAVCVQAKNLKVVDMYFKPVAKPGNQCWLMIKIKNVSGRNLSLYNLKNSRVRAFFTNGNCFCAYSLYGYANDLVKSGSAVDFKCVSHVFGPGRYTIKSKVIYAGEEDVLGPKSLVCEKYAPDLVVKRIFFRTGKMYITLANVGNAPLSYQAYDPANGVAIQAYRGTSPWGAIRLKAVDPSYKLHKPNGILTFEWPFQSPAPGSRIKLVVDANNCVSELKENNNSLTVFYLPTQAPGQLKKANPVGTKNHVGPYFKRNRQNNIPHKQPNVFNPSR